MSAVFTSHDICFTLVTIPICGPVHCVQSNHIRQVRGSVLSDLGILFQNMNLLHFDHIIGLKSLSIFLFILARLNSGLEMDSAPSPSLSGGTVLHQRGRERDRERTVRQRCSLFVHCLNLPPGQECRLLMWCQNLSHKQGCSLFMLCQNLSPQDYGERVQLVYAVSEPTSRERVQPSYVVSEPTSIGL